MSIHDGHAVTDPPGFVVEVAARWSDMDVFHHINHARMVQLMEEARIPWLFHDDKPTAALGNGAVVVDLHVQYRNQLRYRESPFTVTMWVDRLRAVDFTVGYEVRPAGAEADAPPAIIGTTQMASFDIENQKLRRLTPEEREYLGRFLRG